jgi:hypothetical protein
MVGIATITVMAHYGGGDGLASDPVSVTIFKIPTTGVLHPISNNTSN